MSRHLWVLGFIAFVISAGVARADDTPFYQGKTLNVIAGFPPGGGVDGEMRVLTRYFAKFIPGNPTIVSKNMPGAGGIVLGNYLYNTVPPDGLTLGMPGRSGFLLSNVVPQDGISYDLAKFSYVGSGGSFNNMLWLTKATGVATIADFKSAKREINIGALQPRSEDAIVPRVLAKYEGWPLKVVYGYRGFNDVLIAMERGEADGLFSHEGSIKNTRPDMIATGFVHPVAQSFPDAPNLPVLSEIASDPNEKALLGLLSTPSRIGLPLMGPPGIPEARMKILRQSYLRTMKDPEYLAEAERRGLPVGGAVDGLALQKIIATSLSSAPKAVVQEYLSYTEAKGEGKQ
jgi:tripartite-type tricarboxylate transporter receptor subunit TctC